MFARIKVGTRLALAFGVVVLLLVAMLAVSLTRMKGIQAGILEITDVNNEELRAANAMNDAAHDTLINLEGELLSGDLDRSRRLDEVRLEAAKRFEGELGALTKALAADGSTSQQEKDLGARVKSQWEELLPQMNQVAGLALQRKNREASQLYIDTHSDDMVEALAKTLEDITDSEEKLNDESAAQHAGTSKAAQQLILVLGIAAIVLAMVAGGLVTRAIIKQLGGEPDYAASLLQQV
ncbi:MAG TPA: MCP four helix bundle domain-containing protein, partial [Steroidobacteraceae bacterium]